MIARLLKIMPSAMVVFTALTVVIAAIQLRSARSDRVSAERRLHQVSVQVNELIGLRARSQTIARREAPREDLIALVNDALIQAGLPTDRLRDLSPEASRAPPGDSSGIREQAVTLTLSPIEPGELGRFLASWTTIQQVWNAQLIELQHDGRGQTSYTAKIRFVATYIEDGDHS